MITVEESIAEDYGFRLFPDRQFNRSYWRFEGGWAPGAEIPELVWNALVNEYCKRMIRNG